MTPAVATPTALFAPPPDIDPPPHAPGSNAAANATILIFMIETHINGIGANAGSDLSISITLEWHYLFNIMYEIRIFLLP